MSADRPPHCCHEHALFEAMHILLYCEHDPSSPAAYHGACSKCVWRATGFIILGVRYGREGKRDCAVDAGGTDA